MSSSGQSCRRRRNYVEPQLSICVFFPFLTLTFLFGCHYGVSCGSSSNFVFCAALAPPQSRHDIGSLSLANSRLDVPLFSSFSRFLLNFFDLSLDLPRSSQDHGHYLPIALLRDDAPPSALGPGLCPDAISRPPAAGPLAVI